MVMAPVPDDLNVTTMVPMVPPIWLSIVLVSVVILAVVMSLGCVISISVAIIVIAVTLIAPEGLEYDLRLGRRSDCGRGSERYHGCDYYLPHGFLLCLMLSNGNAGLFVPSPSKATSNVGTLLEGPVITPCPLALPLLADLGRILDLKALRETDGPNILAMDTDLSRASAHREKAFGIRRMADLVGDELPHPLS